MDDVSVLKESLIIIGRFGRPRGVKGEISLVSFTDPVENLFHYTPWFIQKQEQWVPIEYTFQGQSGHRFFVSLTEVTDRNVASTLTNREIATYKSILPVLKKDEYYWHELIGMKVFTGANLYLGVVSDLFATGSNDVMIVEGTQKHLIPYLLGRYVLNINKEEEQIIVDWE